MIDFNAVSLIGQIILAGIIGLLILGVIKYGALWCQAYFSEADVTAMNLVGMSLRRVNPSTIVVAWEDSPQDVNHDALKANYEQLSTTASPDGERFNVIRLPLPSPKFCQGQRLPASYCNFYIANGAVIVPQFEDAADDEAIRILAELFPGREVIGLPSLDLVWGLGSFHCVTQQEPAGVKPEIRNPKSKTNSGAEVHTDTHPARLQSPKSEI